PSQRPGFPQPASPAFFELSARLKLCPSPKSLSFGSSIEKSALILKIKDLETLILKTKDLAD
ncbi:MAG: hypothetical protein WBD10_13010, partial [Acidobacteriaceae bacterium]